MARPKKVKPEKIREIVSRMKRMKLHQNNKIQTGEGIGGQPTFHYPTITKAKVAKALGVSADYLTSIKDPGVTDALRHVGQRRASEKELNSSSPRPNTKRYYQHKTQRQSEKIKELSAALKASKQRTLQARLAEKGCSDMAQLLDDCAQEMMTLKEKIRELETENRGHRAKIASLNIHIAKLL